MEMIGQVVLVRTYSAGVHVGELVSLNGKEGKLHNANRIWCWRGANTLNELSQEGADEEYTRISKPVPVILLTEVIEVIPCSAVAADNLRRPRWGTHL